MNHGFFSPSELLPKTKGLANSTQCGKCGLYNECQTPKMPYHGKGQKKILVIGEAPGKQEDEKGEQFIGKAGKRLQYELKRCGINLERDCWKTNAIRCRPPGNKSDEKMMEYCRPSLYKEIRTLKPNHIMLFGKMAAQSVLGHLWGKAALSCWLDWTVPCRDPNSWISVHYHPSYLERQNDDLLNLLFRKGLKKALRKLNKPWKKPRNLEDNISILYREDEALSWLDHFIHRKNMCAFDYETNCTKPEYSGAKIVSCSVSDGIITAAFPWTHNIQEKVSSLLKSNIPKIASNMKFEERWTRYFLGHRVRHWDWDTMLSAHVLNQNPGITGLKFQAFVALGVLPYNNHIEPLLKARSRTDHLNRIDEISLKDLLLYNGMDSLLEYMLATRQKRKTDDGSRLTG